MGLEDPAELRAPAAALPELSMVLARCGGCRAGLRVAVAALAATRGLPPPPPLAALKSPLLSTSCKDS